MLSQLYYSSFFELLQLFVGKLESVSCWIEEVHTCLHQSQVTCWIYLDMYWEVHFCVFDGIYKPIYVVLLILKDSLLHFTLDITVLVLTGKALSLFSLGNHGLVFGDKPGFRVVENVCSWGESGCLGSFEIGFTRRTNFLFFSENSFFNFIHFLVHGIEGFSDALEFVVVVMVLLVFEGYDLISEILELGWGGEESFAD